MRAWVALVPLLAMGCNKTAPAGEGADEVCQLSKNGQQVAVTGYLNSPGVMVDCESRCTFFVSTTRRTGYEGVAVAFPVGDAPGKMQPLPKEPVDTMSGPPRPLSLQELKPKDFVFLTSDKFLFGLGDWIRVEGTLNLTEYQGKLECSLLTLQRVTKPQ